VIYRKLNKDTRVMFPDKGGIGLCVISFDKASVLKSLEKLRDDKAACGMC